jgi:ABC-type transport system substrate-binding protein
MSPPIGVRFDALHRLDAAPRAVAHALRTLLDRADAETNLTRRARLYERASRLVMEFLPMVPYVHAKFAVALRRNVTGYVPETTGPITESFATVGFASS